MSTKHQTKNEAKSEASSELPPIKSSITPISKAESQTSNAKQIDVPDVQTEFKAAIMNFSGNVGKTTLKRFLFEPRMNLDATYSIETINKDGHEGEDDIIVKGGNFEEIQRALLDLDSVLVDIGVTNVEATMRYLNRIEGSYEEFDYFVIPVVKTPKPLRDSVNTIHELLKLGVEPEKIKIVFNCVEDLDDVEDEFADLIFALDEFGVPYDTSNAIMYTEFFPNLENLGVTLEELLSTKVEDNKKELNALKAKAKKEGGLSEDDEIKRVQLINLITTQRYAKTAIRNLDKVYTSLFKI